MKITRKLLETCKHEHTSLIVEWNGHEDRAVCLICDKCQRVLGMTKKDRCAANEMLSKRAALVMSR